MKCLECDGSGIKIDGYTGAQYWREDCPRCKGTGRVDIYTEQELKAMCTPEFIRWMCELAEGFEICYFAGKLTTIKFNDKHTDIEDVIYNDDIFPLLIHRAVEGWNKLNRNNPIIISDDFLTYYHEIDKNITNHDFIDYQPGFLTHAECAMLHCLLNIFPEQA